MAAKAHCLDSDVVIWHLRNTKRRSAVTAFLESLARSGPLICSTLTVAEVLQGTRPNEEARTRAFLAALEDRAVDREVAERAADIVREARAKGRTMGLADALIAATCLIEGLELVTLNVRDFSHVPGLVLVSPP